MRCRPRSGRPAERRQPSEVLDLAVLSIDRTAVRCRRLDTSEPVTFRYDEFWKLVPGEIVTVRNPKQRMYRGGVYVSAEIESLRLDVEALKLKPLRLEIRGNWDPAKEDWYDEGGPPRWAKSILARGVRPTYEMEQVLPGANLKDRFSDPIGKAIDWAEAGHPAKAHRVLMETCGRDLRCLDAHAHLGNELFDEWPGIAIRHYAVGVRIGELSLGAKFEGLLPWGWIDNRPFLRCMRGLGLCAWRVGQFDDAFSVFERMLWLNPRDNQGVRFLLADVRARRPWKPHMD